MWDSDNPSSRQKTSGNAQNKSTLTAPAPLLSAQPVAEQVRVIDGDTLELAGETFRLEGIDAPEMKQRCTDAGGVEYPCGRRAKEHLASLVQGQVSCTVSGHDRYGRSLGYCAAGEIDLNRRMVMDGWAMAFVRYNARYAGDEAKARASKVGIWSGQEAQAPWEWRAEQVEALQPTGDCVIKGNISKGQKTYYMPFHLMYAQVKIDETLGEEWFCTESEATAAGWKRADR